MLHTKPRMLDRRILRLWHLPIFSLCSVSCSVFYFTLSLCLLSHFDVSFCNRKTCVHWSGLCRGACCDSHVSGDGKDHHQADVRLPEELNLWWWLWMCTGGICLGSPRPQSWAGTQVQPPSLSTYMNSTCTQLCSHSECFSSMCLFLSGTARLYRIELDR